MLIRFAAAVAMIALSGCAQQAPRSPYQSVSSASTIPATPARPWKAECKDDRFQDRKKCDLTLSFTGTSGAIVSGQLWSIDGGQTWRITAAPPPVAFRMRVGQNQSIEGVCRGPAGSCDVPNGSRLTEQMKAGGMMALQVTTVRGSFDRDLSIDGFSDALAEVQSQMPPPPEPQRRRAR